MKQGKIRKAIINSEGYKNAMEDVRMGRVYKANSTEEMFQQIEQEMANEDMLQAMKEADEGRTIRCDSFEEYLELVKA